MHLLLPVFLCMQLACGSIFGAAASGSSAATGTEPPVSVPSAILMEASTGTIIYEKNSHESRHPASITKIMTLLLIFEALENGSIQPGDTVTVSEHASSMGGSQVFLETGETQTVDTMIKCISIASANDAAVAMAEHISGSEEAFVQKMNEKAAQLGMKDTHFVNCCGLDTDGHLTSAYDIALMSRELSVRHPKIHDYCTIWMDTITHVTARGSSEFDLANTNKLIRQYSAATGLKTGSTGLAKFCLSATAKKDNLELIAVVMGAENPKQRFADARTLLDYGFANCQLYTDTNRKDPGALPVTGGKQDTAALTCKGDFSYLCTGGMNPSDIESSLSLPDSVLAPVKKGDVLGSLEYRLNGQVIGSVDVVAAESVEKATMTDYIASILRQFFKAGVQTA